jgi:hypothetical protein
LRIKFTATVEGYVGKRPFLIPVVNDGLAASPVIMVFLDDSGTVGWFTFFNYGSAISVAVVVTVALADAYASPNRSNVNTHIISQRRCCKRRNGGGDHQKTIHKNLLSL